MLHEHQHLFILILHLVSPDTINMKYSHIVWLIGTPPSPSPPLLLHCTQTIKIHLLHSFSHCRVSSLGVNKALQDILEAYSYPDSTQRITCKGFCQVSIQWEDWLKAVTEKATCYLQVLSVSLEESIKSISFFSLLWIHLLTSVSNSSGIFILLLEILYTKQ